MSVVPLLRRLADLPPRRFPATEESLWVEMADGVRLATRVFRPRGRERAAGVLVRGLHGVRGRLRPAALLGRLLAEAGYATAVQDVRGRYDSEGVFEPFVHERADGAHSARWLAEQPWCDGRLGAVGAGYAAHAAWAAAAGDPAGAGGAGVVRAVVSILGGGDPCPAWHPGGATALALALRFAAATGEREDVPPRRLDLGRALAFRPVREADRVAVRERPWYREALDHPLPDHWWAARSARPAALPPVLVVGGWHDPWLPASLADWAALGAEAAHAGGAAGAAGAPRAAGPSRGAGAGREAAAAGAAGAAGNGGGEHRLVLGPWSPEQRTRRRRHPRAAWLLRTVLRETLGFLDRHLDGSGGGGAPGVGLWPLGGTRWLDAPGWPPPEARRQRLHLRSRGRAGSDPVDGRLDEEAPGAGETPDRFDYDPERPAPSLEGGALGTAGPVDPRILEAREDVLVYTGAPATAPFRIAGPVRAVLHVSSSAPDTDFVVRLLGVGPEGAARCLAEGVARCRWREGGPEPAWLEPERPVRLEVDLGAACARLARGERLRLHVSSSSLPRFDRSPNTREDPARAVAGALAHQAVLHDAQHPAWVELFVTDE